MDTPDSRGGLPPLPDMTQSMELVVSAKDGDEGALNELIERYDARVRRVARLRLNVQLRKRMDSGDVAQEAFIKFSEKLDDFELRGPASIINYLSRIVANRINDLQRHTYSEKRDPRLETPIERRRASDGSTFELSVAVDDDDAVQSIWADELKSDIDDAITRLASERHREVIIHRDLSGGSWREVAQLSGYKDNVHAAQELYRRAHGKLKEILGPRYREDLF